jgi:membrane fusion protein, multidrug efflux system
MQAHGGSRRADGERFLGMNKNRPIQHWFRAALALAATVVWNSCSGTKAAVPRNPAVPVLAAVAEQKNVPLQLRAIGAVEAYSNVSVKTQITGELTGVHFKEGDDVRKGQLLFTLDRRPFEAALKQAQGMLAKDQAQAANARTQAKRYEGLYKSGVISKEVYDQTQANADALDAAVIADQAAVENARVQLIYCSIYSPIDGRTGPLLIHQGNMIKANDTPFLVSINQVQPIYTTFTVPEQYLPQIKNHASPGKLRVQAFIPNDDRGPVSGWLSFIDNTVDQSTGTIKLKAQFRNTDRRLWPGQFVDVSLILADQANAIVIPAQALQTGQQGQFVFLIQPDLKVEARQVVVDRSSDGQAVIAKGLAPGERVVTDGQLRLVPGSQVELRPTAPGAAPGATPAEKNNRTQPRRQPQRAGGA